MSELNVAVSASYDDSVRETKRPEIFTAYSGIARKNKKDAERWATRQARKVRRTCHDFKSVRFYSSLFQVGLSPLPQSLCLPNVGTPPDAKEVASQTHSRAVAGAMQTS